ncbi:MAG: hypothetical protein DI563_12610 [Variovorax paradoxus]|uniref:Uncharacterized protein n=1 Tax=Variovorax paradoxus TaxID=34073 RepID=A0A2W5S3N3_VARPD|nr:MAG: hypothetical protein DI563_12610 [Variovorax paradoxus]
MLRLVLGSGFSFAHSIDGLLKRFDLPIGLGPGGALSIEFQGDATIRGIGALDGGRELALGFSQIFGGALALIGKPFLLERQRCTDFLESRALGSKFFLDPPKKRFLLDQLGLRRTPVHISARPPSYNPGARDRPKSNAWPMLPMFETPVNRCFIMEKDRPLQGHRP